MLREPVGIGGLYLQRDLDTGPDKSCKAGDDLGRELREVTLVSLRVEPGNRVEAAQRVVGGGLVTIVTIATGRATTVRTRRSLRGCLVPELGCCDVRADDQCRPDDGRVVPVGGQPDVAAGGRRQEPLPRRIP